MCIGSEVVQFFYDRSTSKRCNFKLFIFDVLSVVFAIELVMICFSAVAIFEYYGSSMLF